jgi:hypothetical protein
MTLQAVPALRKGVCLVNGDAAKPTRTGWCTFLLISQMNRWIREERCQHPSEEGVMNGVRHKIWS